MKEYRFRLEKGSRKFPCPECSKKRFVRYVDVSTGEYLPEMYGKCDRADNCGYFRNPYQDGYAANMNSKSTEGILGHEKFFSKGHFLRKQQIPIELQSIPIDVVKATLQGYEYNNFVQNLLERVPFPFAVEEVERVVALYYLGTITTAYLRGAVTFPFIDIEQQVRAVQVKQFDQTNHTVTTNKLDKMLQNDYKIARQPNPEWLTKYIEYGEQHGYFTCLFGEHLLKTFPNNPVALVEAPKTAIYGTLYFGIPESPEDLIWLAVYNKSSFSLEKMKVLKGRNVCVFPDLSKDGKTYLEWHTKAKVIQAEIPGLRFVFSDFLERLAPMDARNEGADLADFLIRWDWRQFRALTINSVPPASIEKGPTAISANSEKSAAVEKEKENGVTSDLTVLSCNSTDLGKTTQPQVSKQESLEFSNTSALHDRSSLIAVAKTIMAPFDSYDSDAVKTALGLETNGDPKILFDLLVQRGIIVQAGGLDAYYLWDSSPF